MKGKLCSVKQCSRNHRSKGLCSKHYNRLIKTGTTYALIKPRLKGSSTYEKVVLNIKINNKTECWEFQGSLSETGYSKVRDSQKDKMVRGHRVVWEYHNGPIPNGMCVLHKCDNPSCVKLEHLFLGTQKDNMRDMISKGRGR